MGNPNKKGSVSTVGVHRVASKTSTSSNANSNLSPEAIAAIAAKLSAENAMRGMSSLKRAEFLAPVKTSRGIQLPGLPFKSMMNGTLNTPNGTPAMRPAMYPLPAASAIAQLSAASPSFVPVTPSPRPAGLPTRPSPGYEKVQNLLQDMRSSPTQGGRSDGRNEGLNGGYNGGHNGGFGGPGGNNQQSHGQAQFASTIARYPTPPGAIGSMSRTSTPSPYPSSVHPYDSVPRGPRNPGALSVQPAPQVQAIAQQPTREFLARKDRGKKDLLITADGITRNHVRIVERQLPNGLPYQSCYNDFDGPKYDFVEDFTAMSAEDKENFLAKNFIDILVQMKTPEEELELTGGAKIEESKGKKGKGKNKLKSKAKESEENLEVKEADDAKETKEESGGAGKSTAVAKREVTSLDVLKSLGPEAAAHIKRLTVTLAFPPSSNPADLGPTTGGGLVPQLSFTPASGPATTSTDFIFLKKLVNYIHTFTNLTHLTIILRVPATQRMPFTMPQLYHVLPFYDLGFTDWDIKYLPENLSVPAKVQGWAVGQLDRERNKIITERLREVEEAVFVRGSIMPGISNKNLKAAAAEFNSAGASTATASGARASRNSRSSRTSQ